MFARIVQAFTTPYFKMTFIDAAIISLTVFAVYLVFAIPWAIWDTRRKRIQWDKDHCVERDKDGKIKYVKFS